MRVFIRGVLFFAACMGAAAQTPERLPFPYGLARETDVREEYIDTVERLVRWLHRHQNDEGAILDLVLRREHQYTTPYYCFALFTCRAAGRCEDLEQSFHDAMDHCTAQVEGGSEAIPDQHGEFFLAALGELLYLIEAHAERSNWIDARSLSRWRERMSAPVEHIIEDPGAKLNNHRAYAMKGEFFRGKIGLVSPDDADQFITDAWETRGMRYRINQVHLFEDWNGEPQSIAVDAVARANLIPIALERPELLPGFNPRTSVLSMIHLQDPTGQCPPNGRTDNHVFNDLLYGTIFEAMHGAFNDRHRVAGDAAALAFESAQRWLREDPPYDGIFSITKNHFEPAGRIGYQPASQISNYTATAAMLVAQSWWYRLGRTPGDGKRLSDLDPANYYDSRMGGVAVRHDDSFAFVNLRGDSVPKYGIYWTPLGIVRLSRANWDSRLGPSDGHYDARSRTGLTLAPTWPVGQRWVRLAETAEHYRGFIAPETGEYPGEPPNEDHVTSILYAPVTGVGGPMFEVDVRHASHGILMTFRSPSDALFGVTLPVLVDDGRELEVTETEQSVSVRYPEELSDGSEQHFIVLNQEPTIQKTEARVLSTYGWLQEYRVTVDEPEIAVFAYMRRKNEPAVDVVLAALRDASPLDSPTDTLESIFASLAEEAARD